MNTIDPAQMAKRIGRPPRNSPPRIIKQMNGMNTNERPVQKTAAGEFSFF
ncbi:hypothetical protein [Bacillus sp. mrc49]|nr:hypothetical protein [Bacillus sp. mrc49]